MKTNPNSHYWLALANLPGIGPVTVRRWLETFDDIPSLFLASVDEMHAAGVTPKQQALLRTINWKIIADQLFWCEKNDCHLITLVDDQYPDLLREIASAPLLLFVQGDPSLLKKPQMAIVGSRNPSIIGKELAEQFAYYLAKAGLIITSGLALGIDAASHQGAISSGGKTLAILGSGLNSIYPPKHRKLAETIIANGALISEFMPNEMPKANHFPRRNRIISGLSLGVLVVEAALQSGSLITARFANEQGREVFAIPGSIHNPLSRGCHQLIREGAKLAETAEDVLEELGALYAFTQAKKPEIKVPDDVKLDVKSRELLTKIGFEVAPLDAIILRSGLTASEVSSMLLSLEMLGYVQNVPGGYIRCG